MLPTMIAEGHDEDPDHGEPRDRLPEHFLVDGRRLDRIGRRRIPTLGGSRPAQPTPIVAQIHDDRRFPPAPHRAMAVRGNVPAVVLFPPLRDGPAAASDE
jgi:hypothetical protein